MRSLPWFIAALVPALCYGAPPLKVDVSPPQLILGTGKTAKIHLTLPAQDAERVHTSASLGELHALSQSSRDGQDFLFVPPSSRFPVTAVLLFWVENPRPDQFTVVRLPLVGRTTLQIVTEPFARVHIRVGDQLFGPVKARGDGAVNVPVEVPPGIHGATVIAEVDGQKSERNVPLPAPPATSLTSALSPPSIHPGENALWAVAHSSPITGRIIKVAARGASATLIDRDRDRAIYLVKPDNGAQNVSLSAEVVGEDGVATSIEAPITTEEVAAPTYVPPPPKIGSFIPFFNLGFFFGGENNIGPSLSGGVSVPLPVLSGRLSAELEIGLRTASYGLSVPGLGELDSRLWGIPLTAGARFRALNSGTFGLDLRAGVGAAYFHHATWANFEQPYSENGFNATGFLAVSTSLRFPRWEPFAELKLALSPSNTPHLQAEMGGLLLSVGGRFHGS